MPRYILIEKDTVKEIIISDYHHANTIARIKVMSCVCGDNLPVNIGDKWDGKDFSRDGVKIEKTPTEEEKIALLAVENMGTKTEIEALGKRIEALELRVSALEPKV